MLFFRNWNRFDMRHWQSIVLLLFVAPVVALLVFSFAKPRDPRYFRGSGNAVFLGQTYMSRYKNLEQGQVVHLVSWPLRDGMNKYNVEILFQNTMFERTPAPSHCAVRDLYKGNLEYPGMDGNGELFIRVYYDRNYKLSHAELERGSAC